ncbi:MAG: precorrin-8X methylmutase [Dehalococcoidia bacterium]|nr:precorrin-8X methylmutase [Dehalococcoidia bacterium]
MPRTGVIILCHGSRGERGIVEVPKVLRGVTEGVKSLLPPGVEVIGAALQFNHPNLEEAVESLAVRGVERIVIMPYFLFLGRHITEHIPQLIEKLKHIYPERQFIMANPLGLEEHFIGHVAKRIEEAAPELLNAHTSPTSPEAIEQQSMEIVERLLPPAPNISGEERLVVKRVAHASGDPQVAPLIKFSPSAISSGLSAIAKGSPIFTDVQMVAAGINRHLAIACGCSLSCAMDETKGLKQAKEQNITRAAAAMRHLGKRLNGTIVAIGNAPTALLALLELIDNDGIKPALVVGMPVGFVQAKESKDELMKRNVPYITITGTRGGSAMAVATVNALLKMAVDRNGPDRFNLPKKEAC